MHWGRGAGSGGAGGRDKSATKQTGQHKFYNIEKINGQRGHKKMQSSKDYGPGPGTFHSKHCPTRRHSEKRVATMN